MTVEHLMICPDCGEEHEDNVQRLGMCDDHDSVLRAMLIQHGFGAELELSQEERIEMLAAGQADAMTDVTNSLMMGTMSIFGGEPFIRHDGCPVCVLEGTLGRAVDEVAAKRRKKN